MFWTTNNMGGLDKPQPLTWLFFILLHIFLNKQDQKPQTKTWHFIHIFWHGLSINTHRVEFLPSLLTFSPLCAVFYFCVWLLIHLHHLDIMRIHVPFFPIQLNWDLCSLVAWLLDSLLANEEGILHAFHSRHPGWCPIAAKSNVHMEIAHEVAPKWAT